MTYTYVALLRGIGPSNPNMHPLKLKEAFEKMGFTNVRTVIASGNVVFESSQASEKELESKIEKMFPGLLGFSSSTIVRSKESIEGLIKKNPFSQQPSGKPNVTFFKQIPNENDLPADDKSFATFGLVEGAFCYTVDTNVVKTPEAMLTLERVFGKGITTRTWLTVERILKKMNETA